MKPQSIVFIEEWSKAAKRLTQAHLEHGGREQAVLAWVVDFAQLSLEELSEGQRSDKAREISRFSFDGGLVFSHDNMQPGLKPLDFGIETTKIEPIFPDRMTHLQKTVRTALNAFLDNGAATFPPIEGSFTVTNSRTSDQGRVRFGGSLEATCYFMVGQLLAHYGGLLRRCNKCGKLVLVGRKDKRYCSQSCQIADWKLSASKSSKQRKIKKGGKRHGTKR